MEICIIFPQKPKRMFIGFREFRTRMKVYARVQQGLQNWEKGETRNLLWRKIMPKKELLKGKYGSNTPVMFYCELKLSHAPSKPRLN